MLGSGLGLRIVLGCKVDKIFLWAALVPMERRAPSASNCWPEAPRGGGGAQAGHKALHTCTSWYAYAAMWRQFIQDHNYDTLWCSMEPL